MVEDEAVTGEIAKERSRTLWGAAPAGILLAPGLTPGTREFFDTARMRRNTWELPWLFDLVPFPSYRGKRVLEVGCGAGFDALEFCRHGATYIGIDLVPENVDRAKRHLSFYGFDPEVREGDAERLEFPDASFDLVYSNGVLHHTPDFIGALHEAARVLKPGGELWAIVYHRASIVYWLTLFLFDHVLRLGFLRRSFPERLAMIENADPASRVLVRAYSREELREALRSAGLVTESLWVRKLVREDLPSFPGSARIWAKISDQTLQRLGHRFGWYVIARARKP
jgi:ubiquinone/menaquinone biosynthesis C-methylase UbiE